MLDPKAPSVVSVTMAGCGGCGINLTRPFRENKQLKNALYFDTSMTNTRAGEQANIVTNGSGSGSNRAENARDIERYIPQLSAEHIGEADVAIVQFSLAGGSGSVIGPLLIREYARRKMRVIAVVVADSSSTVGASNTLNSLKTLTAIAKNNDIYLPLIVLSNDQAGDRAVVDALANTLATDLLDILTLPVYEVDRNDRMNWVDPTKIVNQPAGLKLISFETAGRTVDAKIALGADSKEMVDSLLVLHDREDTSFSNVPLPPSRLKKVGFYYQPTRYLIGRISSDVSSIDSIIDLVEKSTNADKAQKHDKIARLETDGDDLIL